MGSLAAGEFDTLVAAGKSALEDGDWSTARGSFRAALDMAATAPVADKARADAFGERMVGVLNDAGLALMTSIGHQVGLFDTLAGLPAATSQQVADAASLQERYALLDLIMPLVPGLPHQLRAGIDVADVGCGSGHAVSLLAAAYPASRFVGYDFSEEAIGAARRKAQAMGLRNAAFEQRDVTELGEHDRFDLITAFDAIHDQAHPAQVLTGLADALRADGVFLMVDVQASSDLEDNLDHALGTFLYTMSTMHCMTVSLALDSDGLGTVWGEQKAQRMLADAGFGSVGTAHIEADILNTYYLARKAAAAADRVVEARP